MSRNTADTIAIALRSTRVNYSMDSIADEDGPSRPGTPPTTTAETGTETQTKEAAREDEPAPAVRAVRERGGAVSPVARGPPEPKSAPRNSRHPRASFTRAKRNLTVDADGKRLPPAARTPLAISIANVPEKPLFPPPPAAAAAVGPASAADAPGPSARPAEELQTLLYSGAFVSPFSEGGRSPTKKPNKIPVPAAASVSSASSADPKGGDGAALPGAGTAAVAALLDLQPSSVLQLTASREPSAASSHARNNNSSLGQGYNHGPPPPHHHNHYHHHDQGRSNASGSIASGYAHASLFGGGQAGASGLDADMFAFNDDMFSDAAESEPRDDASGSDLSLVGVGLAGGGRPRMRDHGGPSRRAAADRATGEDDGLGRARGSSSELQLEGHGLMALPAAAASSEFLPDVSQGLDQPFLDFDEWLLGAMDFANMSLTESEKRPRSPAAGGVKEPPAAETSSGSPGRSPARRMLPRGGREDGDWTTVRLPADILNLDDWGRYPVPIASPGNASAVRGLNAFWIGPISNDPRVQIGWKFSRAVEKMQILKRHEYSTNGAVIRRLGAAPTDRRGRVPQRYMRSSSSSSPSEPSPAGGCQFPGYREGHCVPIGSGAGAPPSPSARRAGHAELAGGSRSKSASPELRRPTPRTIEPPRGPIEIAGELIVKDEGRQDEGTRAEAAAAGDEGDAKAIGDPAFFTDLERLHGNDSDYEGGLFQFSDDLSRSGDGDSSQPPALGLALLQASMRSVGSSASSHDGSQVFHAERVIQYPESTRNAVNSQSLQTLAADMGRLIIDRVRGIAPEPTNYAALSDFEVSMLDAGFMTVQGAASPGSPSRSSRDQGSPKAAIRVPRDSGGLPKNILNPIRVPPSFSLLPSTAERKRDKAAVASPAQAQTQAVPAAAAAAEQCWEEVPTSLLWAQRQRRGKDQAVVRTMKRKMNSTRLDASAAAADEIAFTSKIGTQSNVLPSGAAKAYAPIAVNTESGAVSDALKIALMCLW
jgi:hypothetical protein